MTPERRAEFALLVGGALHQQPIFSAAELGEVLAALDMAEARERRLREALEEAVEFADQDWQCLTPAGDAMLAKWRTALSEGGTDA